MAIDFCGQVRSILWPPVCAGGFFAFCIGFVENRNSTFEIKSKKKLKNLSLFISAIPNGGTAGLLR